MLNYFGRPFWVSHLFLAYVRCVSFHLMCFFFVIFLHFVTYNFDLEYLFFIQKPFCYPDFGEISILWIFCRFQDTIKFNAQGHCPNCTQFRAISIHQMTIYNKVRRTWINWTWMVQAYVDKIDNIEFQAQWTLSTVYTL